MEGSGLMIMSQLPAPCREITAELDSRSLPDLKTVWTDPATDARLKKRIVSTLIKEVIADIEPKRPRSFWWSIGLAASTPSYACPNAVVGQRNHAAADVIAAVRQLVLIANDDVHCRHPQPEWPRHGSWQPLDT